MKNRRHSAENKTYRSYRCRVEHFYGDVKQYYPYLRKKNWMVSERFLNLFTCVLKSLQSLDLILQRRPWEHTNKWQTDTCGSFVCAETDVVSLTFNRQTSERILLLVLHKCVHSMCAENLRKHRSAGWGGIYKKRMNSHITRIEMSPWSTRETRFV